MSKSDSDKVVPIRILLCFKSKWDPKIYKLLYFSYNNLKTNDENSHAQTQMGFDIILLSNHEIIQSIKSYLILNIIKFY